MFVNEKQKTHFGKRLAQALPRKYLWLYHELGSEAPTEGARPTLWWQWRMSRGCSCAVLCVCIPDARRESIRNGKSRKRYDGAGVTAKVYLVRAILNSNLQSSVTNGRLIAFIPSDLIHCIMKCWSNWS